MFVRARIDEGVQPDAILIPQQGVSRTPRGDATVLIVNDKSQGKRALSLPVRRLAING